MNYPESAALPLCARSPRELAELLGQYATGVACRYGIWLCRPQIWSSLRAIGLATLAVICGPHAPEHEAS